MSVPITMTFMLSSFSSVVFVSESSVSETVHSMCLLTGYDKFKKFELENTFVIKIAMCSSNLFKLIQQSKFRKRSIHKNLTNNASENAKKKNKMNV